MSDEKKIDINLLYSILIRETENDSVQEINPELFLIISNLTGKLKSEDYDGIETKIKNKLILLISEMVSLLLQIRVEKAIKTNETTNLTDVEKFIIDSKRELEERKETILSGILNGKSKLLESIAQSHKIKPTAMRFLQDMEQIVGVDLKNYGPFKAEDIATIPYENASALISKKLATKIKWEN